MLITESNTIAANASEVFTFAPEFRITQPRPSDDPTNSPITAPITASEIPILSPTKMCGIAEGKRNIRKICRSEAQSERASSTSSAGVLRRPVAVEITIGKDAEQERDDDLRAVAEVHPEDQDRRDRDLRDGVEPEQDRVDRPLEQARVGDRDRDRDPDRNGEPEAGERLEQRHPELTREQVALDPEGAGDVERRGHEPDRPVGSDFVTGQNIFVNGGRLFS